jgi:hypothetical protein
VAKLKHELASLAAANSGASAKVALQTVNVKALEGVAEVGDAPSGFNDSSTVAALAAELVKLKVLQSPLATTDHCSKRDAQVESTSASADSGHTSKRDQSYNERQAFVQTSI